MKPKDKRPTLWTRRDLLTRSGWAFVWASITVAVLGSIRMLFPRVSFAPRSKLVLGPPEQFAVGEVSARWKSTHQVIIVRNEEGFFALRAVCTHLGCIPVWRPLQRKFKCPCHGSGFYSTGINFEGPAPRPLERLKIEIDDAGQLVVDTAVRFREERGEWERPHAFAAYAPEQADTHA